MRSGRSTAATLGPSLASLALAAACGDDPAPAPVEPAPAPAATAPAYADDGPYLLRDVTADSGLAGFLQVNGDTEKPFIVETVGGGCALFDADQDGDLDAYLTNGGKLGRPVEENPSDALYLNDGSGRFADASASAGIDERRWSNGVRATDVDGDGVVDIFVTNYGCDTFWLGLGAARYADRTQQCNLADTSWSTGAAFLDFDHDGDLDLYVANYVDFDEPRMLAERPTIEYQGVEVMKGPVGLAGAPDAFHVNEGGLRFREASAELGLHDELFGFQPVVFDFDLDGWIDVFVGNDSVANSLWRNKEGKGFEDVALRQGVALSLSGRPQACMGVALGDYDGDQRPDMYITNFADDYSTLYHGEERGFFSDVTQAVGLAAPTMAELGWGTGFVDFDLDGDVEIYAVNGHVYPQVDRFRLGTEYHQQVQLFESEGRRWREPAGRGGVALGVKASARGSATGDVDGDGDVDLLVENIDGPPRLLRNDGRTGKWVAVELRGAGANRDAIGARLVGRVGARSIAHWIGSSHGFLSTSERRAVFGLGDAGQLDALEVTWPGGEVERFGPLEAGSRWVVQQGDAGAAGKLVPK